MAAPAALRPFIASLHAYDVDLGAPGIHRGLPSTALTFVLPVDEPLDVAWADGTDRQVEWSCLSGLHLAPAAIRHHGSQRGVQVDLTVAGARALFGVPAAAWHASMLTLGDLAVGADALRSLPERLHETPSSTWADLVLRTLADSLARNGVSGPRAEVGQALALLTGGGRVRDVAEEVGFSRRRLSDLVRAETGVTPKEFQRLARFGRTRRLLGRRPLAEVAEICGYADQAHLTREWSEMAGCTPGAWLREEFPYLQDSGPDQR